MYHNADTLLISFMSREDIIIQKVQLYYSGRAHVMQFFIYPCNGMECSEKGPWYRCNIDIAPFGILNLRRYFVDIFHCEHLSFTQHWL
jgi:hypothetical protein